MSTVELDPPEAGTVVTFSDLDRVGRVRLASGEELRFGASACKEGVPSVGAAVFVTAVGAHPMGGRKAVTLRLRPVSEAAARVEVQTATEAKARAAEQEREARRAIAVTTTTTEAVVARVRAAAPADDEDEDRQLIGGIVADLELMPPSVEHVTAIVRGIAESPPMAHFGSPGGLVHYAERFSEKGYEDVLFPVAREVPTAHFVWMLARLADPSVPRAEEARAILRSYLTNPQTPAALRDEVERLFASRAWVLG